MNYLKGIIGILFVLFVIIVAVQNHQAFSTEVSFMTTTARSLPLKFIPILVIPRSRRPLAWLQARAYPSQGATWLVRIKRL